MIRFTMLYNLQPFVDEDEFLGWRLTEHQQENIALPGVIRTDFARAEQNWPDNATPPYRFMTIIDWPDEAQFKKDFYNPTYQKTLQENMKILKDPVFFVSEILVQDTKDE